MGTWDIAPLNINETNVVIMFLSTFTKLAPEAQRSKVPCHYNTISKWCSTDSNPNPMVSLLLDIASQHILDSRSDVLDTSFSHLSIQSWKLGILFAILQKRELQLKCTGKALSKCWQTEWIQCYRIDLGGSQR